MVSHAMAEADNITPQPTPKPNSRFTNNILNKPAVPIPAPVPQTPTTPEPTPAPVPAPAPVPQAPPVPPIATGQLFTSMKEVPQPILTTTKDVYFTFKNEYDASTYFGYPLWESLTEHQKLFWANFAKETHRRYCLITK